MITLSNPPLLVYQYTHFQENIKLFKGFYQADGIYPIKVSLTQPFPSCDSESWGQEEVQQCDHLSELFARSTALKFANAPAKLPWKILLSYYRLRTFLLYGIDKPRMEEISVTIPKYQPLQILMALVVQLHTTNHPFPPDLSVTRELVPSLFEESITWSSSKSFQPFFWYGLIKSFLSPQKFICGSHFFFLSFIFITHFFRGLAGACVNPGSYFQTFFLYKHLFV